LEMVSPVSKLCTPEDSALTIPLKMIVMIISSFIFITVTSFFILDTKLPFPHNAAPIFIKRIRSLSEIDDSAALDTFNTAGLPFTSLTRV